MNRGSAGVGEKSPRVRDEAHRVITPNPVHAAAVHALPQQREEEAAATRRVALPEPLTRARLHLLHPCHQTAEAAEGRTARGQTDGPAGGRTADEREDGRNLFPR